MEEFEERYKEELEQQNVLSMKIINEPTPENMANLLNEVCMLHNREHWYVDANNRLQKEIGEYMEKIDLLKKVNFHQDFKHKFYYKGGGFFVFKSEEVSQFNLTKKYFSFIAYNGCNKTKKFILKQDEESYQKNKEIIENYF